MNQPFDYRAAVEALRCTIRDNSHSLYPIVQADGTTVTLEEVQRYYTKTYPDERITVRQEDDGSFSVMCKIKTSSVSGAFMSKAQDIMQPHMSLTSAARVGKMDEWLEQEINKRREKDKPFDSYISEVIDTLTKKGLLSERKSLTAVEWMLSNSYQQDKMIMDALVATQRRHTAKPKSVTLVSHRDHYQKYGHPNAPIIRLTPHQINLEDPIYRMTGKSASVNFFDVETYRNEKFPSVFSGLPFDFKDWRNNFHTRQESKFLFVVDSCSYHNVTTYIKGFAQPTTQPLLGEKDDWVRHYRTRLKQFNQPTIRMSWND